MERFRGDLDIDIVERRHVYAHEWLKSVAGFRKGPEKAGYLLEVCRFMVEMMANEPGATEVGKVLLNLLEDHGILLADVHTGNIGMYQPEDYPKPIRVITDPGHAMFLKDTARPNPMPWWAVSGVPSRRDRVERGPWRNVRRVS